MIYSKKTTSAINWNSPFARGLLAAFVPTQAGFVDLVLGNNAFSAVGAKSSLVDIEGRNRPAYKWGASAAFDGGATTPAFVSGRGLSIAVWYAFAASPSGYGQVVTRDAGTGTDWGVQHVGNSQGLSFGRNGSQGIYASYNYGTNWHLWHFTLDAADAGAVYVDGELSPNQTGSITTRTANGIIRVNRRSDGSYANGSTGNIYLWGRHTTAAEARAFYHDELSLFVGKAKVFFVPSGGTTAVAVGAAAETDAAQALSKSKTKALGHAAETDAAQALTVRKSLAVGAATETDAAQSLGKSKSLAVGHAAETDAAQAITAVGQTLVDVGAATETDAAQAIGKSKVLAVGAASESDAAQAITRYVPGVQTVAVDPATESDSAEAIGKRKTLSLGSINETDAAQIILPRKSLALQPATESDSAQAIAWSPKIRQLGVASEMDAAQAITLAAAGLTLEQKCDLLLKILTNKTITDPATGLMTIYDDDDTTPLLTASLFEDAAAAIPYRGRGAERREKLSPPS